MRGFSIHNSTTDATTTAPTALPSHQMSQMCPNADHGTRGASARLVTPIVALIVVLRNAAWTTNSAT